MAKFKVGDKVTDGSGVYLITGIDNSFGSYEWKLVSGRADTSHSKGGDFGWADSKMKLANSCARNDRVKGHFVWFAPWNGRAGEAADEIVAKVPGAKREGANIVRVKDADSAATVYALFRKAKVPTRDLNIGFNSSSACNAKIVTPENFSSLRVGDKVDFRKSRYYKGIGIVTKVYDEDIIDIKDDKGEILEVHSDDIMNARACNSRNPIVRKAMNACATNGAYPKSLSKAVGKVEAAFIPKENFMMLERGDYRSSDYVSLEGSPADVRRKARASLEGKDLSDAMSLCEWADSEMEKYRKSEQRHGRKVAQNGRDILMELGTIEGDIEDGDMAEARSWLREIKNEAMRKGYYKEWNQLAMRAGM